VEGDGLKTESRKFQLRVIIGIPLIFFGLTIFTALITYYLTTHYISSSINLPYELKVDSPYLFRLQLWVFGVAIFSFLCGFGLIYAIIHPINKLLARAEELASFHREGITLPSFKGDDEIERFCSIFDEVLTLLKSHLRERELREAMPLLNRVRRADQLAGLGFLSARLAHEMRNPLGSMQGLVELMDKDFQKDDVKRNYVKVILESIERLNVLVEELLKFARPGSEKLELQDINHLLKEAVNFAENGFAAKGIEVIEEYQDNLPLVQIDPQKVYQALLNIIRNAFQFTPEGGTIRIATISQPTNSIAIRFFNSGSYIPSEDLDRIFVPFFTTQKQGVGLGLCIAYHTIAAHGGHIQVESSRDSGTTFIIELPMNPGT